MCFCCCRPIDDDPFDLPPPLQPLRQETVRFIDVDAVPEVRIQHHHHHPKTGVWGNLWSPVRGFWNYVWRPRVHLAPVIVNEKQEHFPGFGGRGLRGGGDAHVVPGVPTGLTRVSHRDGIGSSLPEVPAARRSEFVAPVEPARVVPGTNRILSTPVAPTHRPAVHLEPVRTAVDRSPPNMDPVTSYHPGLHFEPIRSAIDSFKERSLHHQSGRVPSAPVARTVSQISRAPVRGHMTGERLIPGRR